MNLDLKMVEKKNIKYFTDLASENIENIKKSIAGLIEILYITLSDNNDEIFYDLALDNIKILSRNFLELVLNEEGLETILQQGQLSSFEINIPSKENSKSKLKDLDQNPKKTL